MTKQIQTASHWGVYHVAVDDRGNITGSSPIGCDPNPSALHHGLPEMVRSELRIDRPYVRETFLRHRGNSGHLRGRDRFVAVSWDEALALVAGELSRVK